MYRIHLTHIQDMTFQVAAEGGGSCVLDALGKKGMTPPDALLAALGSCVGVYLKKYSQTAQLNLSNFEISVAAEFSRESPVCFRAIQLTIDLKGASLDERRRKALLEFVKNCPVHHTLKNNPTVDISLV